MRSLEITTRHFLLTVVSSAPPRTLLPAFLPRSTTPPAATMPMPMSTGGQVSQIRRPGPNDEALLSMLTFMFSHHMPPLSDQCELAA
ncbi:hypothetical protein PYCCODRAFT_1437708 [Trametes coccinea BRFM310]|uniref:Uncharacterized protein n=1 Tax=Trametes coccinea (strain BRFM310) TaxID=1353009 RepID=A0A1Y2IG68_TRAC3|nr:hypothetical protein PYCCODRAFT_1437708 [Trametes coccinea BRFM310]